MVFKNFQEAYNQILVDLVNYGSKVTVRGLDMLEWPDGVYQFTISNPRDRLLNIDCRSNIKKYIFGELLWYLSGRDDVEFISRYSKVWARLADDGLHNNSAYGKYIFRPMPKIGFGSYYGESYSKFIDDPDNYMTQWDFVKETLKKDPYSRQAVIHIKPIQMYDTKDTTCTYFLQFFIRNNKLNMVACMRSNDILKGTTFDVFMFTFMQELMAAELGVELGTYTHIACNLHMYMSDIDTVNNIIDENICNKQTHSFKNIESNFREHDLPILLELEKEFSDNGKVLTADMFTKMGELSAASKDLVETLLK